MKEAENKETCEVTVEVPLRVLKDVVDKLSGAMNPTVKFVDDIDKMRSAAKAEADRSVAAAYGTLVGFLGR